MGPVDENTQTFQLDCYFRQYWEDFRLKFNGSGLTELPMNWQFLTDIWIYLAQVNTQGSPPFIPCGSAVECQKCNDRHRKPEALKTFLRVQKSPLLCLTQVWLC